MIPVIRRYRFFLLLFLLSTVFLPQAVVTAADIKKIVLIAGALDSHPAATHEYEKSVRLLKHCLDTAPNLPPLTVEAVFNGWPANEATLEDADTIVFVSAGSDQQESAHPLFSGERMAVIDRQTRRGCGLAMIHWSTFAPLRLNAKILEWTGGFFDYESGPGANKWRSAITTRDDWTVSPGTPGHRVNNGAAEPFRLKEEFYCNYKIRFRDEDPRL